MGYKPARIPAFVQTIRDQAGGVLPLLAIDYTMGEYFTPLFRPAFDTIHAFSRTGDRYSDASDGSLTSFATDVPRRTDKGLAGHAGATNLYLNSATPATQVIAVTAQAYTLSFNGTGTLTLSGASTAGPLVGTGANDRVSLTFTPSAGNLTLTLSGTITEPQLETGSNATPYIPTTGSTASATADDADIEAPTATEYAIWRTDQGAMITPVVAALDWPVPIGGYTEQIAMFADKPANPADHKYMIAYSDDTTVDNMRIDGLGNVDVLFVGANGATYTETLASGVEKDGIDLAAEGLTAPVQILWPSSVDSASLTQFSCYINQLTGSIPDLSANTALTVFLCYTNQLTGSIPELSANTALTIFSCSANQLTGSIPDLSANTALTIFSCHTNQLTGVAGSFAVPASLTDFRAYNNNLTEAAVDAILAAFVAAGATGGALRLEVTNAPPSSSGLSDKTTLEGRGWTVTVAS